MKFRFLLWMLGRLMAEGASLARGGALNGRARRVLLVGAGSAGDLVARELRRQGARRLAVSDFWTMIRPSAMRASRGSPCWGGSMNCPRWRDGMRWTR